MGVERRCAMLDAATELFLERGYEGTTLDAVIERTGGSRRRIYEEFGGKEGLLEAIVFARCSGLQQRIVELSLENLPPKEMLTELGLFFAETMLTEDGVKLYRLLVQESGRNPRLGQLLFAAGVSPSHERLRQYFETETRNGRLDVRDPAFAASLFFGMIKNDLHMRAVFGVSPIACREELRHFVEQAVEVFLNGVRARTPKPSI